MKGASEILTISVETLAALCCWGDSHWTSRLAKSEGLGKHPRLSVEIPETPHPRRKIENRAKAPTKAEMNSQEDQGDLWPSSCLPKHTKPSLKEDNIIENLQTFIHNGQHPMKS